MKFIFVEDRDWETGHGWRDGKHQFFLDHPDGSVYVRAIADEEDEEDCVPYGPRHYPQYSYAWICPEEYYLKHKHIQDNIRTTDVKEHYPEFAGVDNMESHFEFRMNPGQMRRHLLSLGFTEVKKNSK